MKASRPGRETRIDADEQEPQVVGDEVRNAPILSFLQFSLGDPFHCGSEASPNSRPSSVNSGGSGDATGDASSPLPGSWGADGLHGFRPWTIDR